MMMKHVYGAVLLSLMLCSASCAHTKPVPETVTVHLRPPEHLLVPIELPVLEGKTNGALLAWALALRRCVERANADRAAILIWSK